MKAFTFAAVLIASSGVFAMPQAESITKITPTITRPTLTPTLPPQPSPTTCTCPNPILCCSEIVDSNTRVGQKVIRELGMVINGAHIPVGVNCSPHRICPPGMMCVSNVKRLFSLQCTDGIGLNSLPSPVSTRHAVSSRPTVSLFRFTHKHR